MLTALEGVFNNTTLDRLKLFQTMNKNHSRLKAPKGTHYKSLKNDRNFLECLAMIHYFLLTF